MRRRATARYTRAMKRRTLLGSLALAPAFWSRALAEAVGVPRDAFLKPLAPTTAASDVLNVMDFEPLARDALPPAHFGYIATGADDDGTVVRNHAAFSDYEIRARRFNDLSHLTTATTIFGERWTSPLYLSAVSAMRAFHPEAELAAARAAKSRNTQMMLSTGADTGVEDALAAHGAPLWQQLYATNDWDVTTALVRRAERAGCTAIFLTVDSPGARNNETLKRAMRIDNRDCNACHVNGNHNMWAGPKRAMFADIDTSRVTGLAPAALTTAYLDRLRGLVKVKLVLKGVVTSEDAQIAINHGADGVVVSNHGGRNEETLRATIDCLPEVLGVLRGRIPVFLDGGVRRGTDIFKALAMGASGVGIGRPQAWGLAAFGQSGVEAVLDILNTELTTIMRQAGTPTIASIRPEFVVNAKR